jgi:type II secretory pathway component PulK
VNIGPYQTVDVALIVLVVAGLVWLLVLAWRRERAERDRALREWLKGMR